MYPLHKYGYNSRLENIDNRKNIPYKCRACKRQWTAHNFRETRCIFCKSNKINEVK